MALQDFLMNPAVQTGLGILAGNQGVNQRQAFGNALQGGLGQMQRAQMMQAQMQQQQQLAQMNQLRQQQMIEAAERRRREQEISQRLGGLLQSGAGREEIMAAMAELDPRAAIGMMPQEMSPYEQARIGLRERELAQQGQLARARMAQQAQLARARAAQPQVREDPFAKRGISGAAYSVLAQAREAERTGQPLTPEMQDQVTIAEKILTTPQIMRSPTGELMQYTPGLPQFSQPQGVAPPQEPGPEEAPAAPIPQGTGGYPPMFTPDAAPAPAPAPTAQQEQVGSWKTIFQGPQQKQFEDERDKMASLFRNVVSVLDKAEKENVSLSGPAAYLQSQYGGSVLESMGIPGASGLPSELQSDLIPLQFSLAKMVQSDPRVSNEDRQVIAQWAAGPAFFESDEHMRKQLIKVYDLVKKYYGDIL